MGTSDPSLADELRLAWDEHRLYVAFAGFLFALGLAIGVLMVGRYDLFAAMGLENPEDLFPDRITLWTLLANNTRVFVLMLVGVLTLGLLTVVALVFNGLILGYLVIPIASEEGLLFPLVGLLPHGVLELGAFFVAAGISFRILRRTVDRIRGKNDVVLGRNGWRRAALLFVAAWLVLAVAAVIEMYVTSTLLQFLFG